jgi:hypothetical protein
MQCSIRRATASFFVADVQTDDLHGRHDAAFSRIGTMFLNLPGFALRNIRQAAPTRQLYSFIHRGAAP